MSNQQILLAAARELYPERDSRLQEGWLASLETRLAVWLAKRRVSPNQLQRRLVAINQLAGEFDHLTLAELAEQAKSCRRQLRGQGFTESAVARAFALVRAVAMQTVAMRHFDCQLMAGLVMLEGMIAEMNTGEGKTLTATLSACTAALAGLTVHVITVNDYLAARDAEILGPIYQALNLTVGVVQSDMSPAERQRAYACDVVYCTNKDVVFDYLRDRLVLQNQTNPLSLQLKKLYGTDDSFKQLYLQGLPFAIVDEADSVLVDEARIPLIISATVDHGEELQILQTALAIARELEQDCDFTVDKQRAQIALQAAGKTNIQQQTASLGGVWNAMPLS